MDVRRAGIALAMGLGLFAVGAASAGADTLYTDATHTDGVAISSTADLASGTLTLSGTFGSTLATDVCTSSTLTTEIRQNDGAVVAATVTGGAFSGCSTGIPVGNFPWTVTVRGTAITSGSDKVYVNTTWDEVSISAFTTFTGTFTDSRSFVPFTGAYTKQNAVVGTNLCFVLADAGTLGGPGVTDVKLTATYCPAGGAAASWSLGPRASYLRADPASTLVASGATISNGTSVTSGFGTGVGSVTCSNTTVGISAGASGGAVVTGALDTVTLASCTDTMPSVAVTSCARFAAGTSPISFTATSAVGGPVTASGLYLRCGLAATTTGCYYSVPTLGGTLTSATTSFTLIGATVDHQVPVGVTDDTGLACGSSGAMGLGLQNLTTGSAARVTLKTY